MRAPRSPVLPLTLLLLAAIPHPVRAALAELNPTTGAIATPDGSFTGRDFFVPPDFKLELLYRGNPGDGNWAPAEWDAQGRLLVTSTARGALRLTIPKIGEPGELTVEAVDLPADVAMRLSRVPPAADGRTYRPGVLDGFFRPDSSAVPKVWGEDNLVPRVLTGTGRFGPGQYGAISTMRADGTDLHIVATGFREVVGIVMNPDGELFAADTATDSDMGTPWYRPVSVSHVISGMDSGWRSDSRMHPAHTLEDFAPIAYTGSGIPLNMVLGTGLKFPAKYQNAVYLLDWSYGRIETVLLTPSGATYKGEAAPFAAGRPWPVSEISVSKGDGSMIVITRGAQMIPMVYRITYTGTESTAPVVPDRQFTAQRDLRRRIESFHGKKDPAAVPLAWQYLGNADEAIQHAARVALEWQDPALWRERALSTGQEPRTAIPAIAALARVSGKDFSLRTPEDPAPDSALATRMLTALDRIDWAKLGNQDRIDLLRAYELTLIRLGPPDAAARQRLLAKFDPLLPAANRELNWALAEMLVYLEAPSAPAKLLALMQSAPSEPILPTKEYVNPLIRTGARPKGFSNAELAKQVDQIQYALLLREHKAGWTPALRAEYFKWFQTAAETFEGTDRLPSALETIRTYAIAAIPPEAADALKETLATPPTYKTAQRGRGAPPPAAPRATGRGPAPTRGATPGDAPLIPLPPGP